MCLLGVAKQKVNLYTPFCLQSHHFGALFRRNLELFARNAFNIGHVLYKRPLIVIVASQNCIVNMHIGVVDSKNVTVFDPLLIGDVIWRMRRHRVRL